jgi:xanthine dehydrogenase accessory factor
VKGAFALVREAVRAGQLIALVSVVEVADVEGTVSLPVLGATIAVRPGLDPFGTLGDARLDRTVVADALVVLESGRSTVRHYGAQGGPGHDVTVFIEVFQAPRRMVIFGAVDFTAALVRAAVNLGYYVVVCDAREVFASARRFPEADEVVVEWPHRYLGRVGGSLGPRDAICVLTHDHKFDVPALVAALGTRVGYLGAMGSRRTHAERTERLREEGVGDEGLARIMAPIGIDIGARTPEETAVAILAEIIAVQSATHVPSLRDRTGPIHPVAP